MPVCVDCGDDHPDPMSHVGVGVVDGLVVLYVYGMPVVLDTDTARDMAKHLVEAADLADWQLEIEEGS